MFESPLPLDPNDTDGLWDVYVLDRVFGGVVRVTLDHINAVMDTYGLQLSDDGRFVLFAADAQIVPEDRWGDLDVHLRDLVTGDVELVSGRHAEVTGLAAMSADAQIVVWTASTDDRAGLDANGSGVDVFVLDRARGIVSRANVDASGAQSDGDAMGATVSADGSVVAFFSNSTALVGHPVPRGDWYPFVYDRVSGAIEMVATSSIGIPSNGPCGYELSLSGDGRRVAFACRASNLVPASTLEQQLFVKDRTSEAITAVIPLDAIPYFHRAQSLSRDGRFIAFASAWCGLGGDVTCSCVAGTHYVRDLATSDVFRLGYEDRCVPSRVFLTSPAPAQWSADGRFAGFSSALRLTPSSDDDVADLFVYSFCRL
ncbi:hypothetical protein L6R52_10530 [Myxococcota bacterium]|nr:hypothetical protein [Myxococcota bacterium]